MYGAYISYLKWICSNIFNFKLLLPLAELQLNELGSDYTYTIFMEFNAIFTPYLTEDCMKRSQMI